jgi:UPF0271 protein
VKYAIDLNSDLGEGFGSWQMGDDAALLGVVTSANIACGFHAGDPATMRRTAAIAVERGISIGAHVAYPDLRGFGRRHVELAQDELFADVLYQIGALEALARTVGGLVAYVKPHGALYNEMMVDAELAQTVVSAILSYRPTLPLLVLPGSVAQRIAQEAGLPNFSEGFADRAYEPDGRLVSRNRPGAVLHDPTEVAARALRMVREGTVVTIDGSVLVLDVATICLHGDTPGAVEMAQAVRAAMQDAGVELAPFVAV